MSHVASERASQHAFLGVSALLFASCAALTIAWCESWASGTSSCGPWSEWPRFPLGVALAEIEMLQPALTRAVPIAVGAVVLIAGALQFTGIYSCGGLMAILLVLGIMDLRTMSAITAAITLERLAPLGERVARAIGAIVIGTGLLLLAQAAWL